MSKIAVISDIHANIDALNLVLKDIEKRNIDKIVCLGDLVTKYFYPAQVVDAIMENCSIVVKGNCDYLVATDQRYKFARGELGIDKIDYLYNLPMKEQLITNKVILNFFHSTPYSLDAMFNPLFDNKFSKYKDKILEISDYDKMFLNDKPQITFVGHTHDDYIAIEYGNELKITHDFATINNSKRAIINVGSVGEHSKIKKNKDGIYVPFIDNYFSYIFIEEKGINEEIHVEIINVPYKETLKSIFFDMIRMQNEKKAPFSPNDSGKIFDSLVNMNINENDIYDELDKRGLQYVRK